MLQNNSVWLAFNKDAIVQKVIGVVFISKTFAHAARLTHLAKLSGNVRDIKFRRNLKALTEARVRQLQSALLVNSIRDGQHHLDRRVEFAHEFLDGIGVGAA